MQLQGNYLMDWNLRLQNNCDEGYLWCALKRTFGDNFRDLQKRSGLKGNEVAAKLGVGNPAVSGWRNNKAGLPETPTLFRIAIALNCTIDELLQGIDHDYDNVRDLVRQCRDLESGQPLDIGGPINVATAARVLSLLQDLVAVLAAQENSTGQMREITQRLFAIVEAGPEGDPAGITESESRRRDRKTG